MLSEENHLLVMVKDNKVDIMVQTFSTFCPTVIIELQSVVHISAKCTFKHNAKPQKSLKVNVKHCMSTHTDI